MTRPRRLPRTLVLSVLVFLAGCMAAGHTSSPWEWGSGVRIAPALWEVGESGMTAHPAAGYTYLSFDGGHDALWEFGGQLRKPMGDSARPFWVGGEATISHLRTSFSVQGTDFSSSTNGFSVTGLIGMPFGDNRWGPNVFAGIGISDYGSQGTSAWAWICSHPSSGRTETRSAAPSLVALMVVDALRRISRRIREGNWLTLCLEIDDGDRRTLLAFQVDKFYEGLQESRL